MKRALAACLFLVIILFTFAGLIPQKMTAQTPQRGFSIQPEYTHLAVGSNEEIKFDVDIVNQGQQVEEIELFISGPEGWESRKQPCNSALPLRKTPAKAIISSFWVESPGMASSRSPLRS